MPIKIIVSYDGTDNDRDALALGRLLADAGASLALAYVRHAHEGETGRERLAEREAEIMLERGASSLGRPDLPRHVVLSASTAEGLRDLAVAGHADMIVFGSEYRTAPGHVDPQATARRLLQGGPTALALAPAGFAEQGGYRAERVLAIGDDGDPCARETAESLARQLGAELAERPTRDADLLVVGSTAAAATGQVAVSAATEYVIELARCPVVVVPRGVALRFGRPPETP
jgi:nucleotide-binding universal stress UspA family protein